ncbi:hypothetical protein QE109_15785 [Fusibacter bizertensis]|jgi:hypothetical protein|uniref:Uncharacterized protein n=1 Tax=Fusibacter bizertensis TaxID=1488331 RepID=A0ABT6NGS9_9FIRM|nr:hypothetical protein [Fusibacter bizertensis]MDH8679621.1 hypothetical protein [Fusibacter bizertensis]
MNFLRFQVRLNTDIYNAYRSLVNIEKILKWTEVRASSITGVPYSQVSWEFEDALDYEFNIMQCAVKTEYCTEIHMLIKLDAINSSKFNEVEALDDFIKSESAKANALLESLRKHFNKDWVIQDRDLTAGILKGSF